MRISSDYLTIPESAIFLRLSKRSVANLISTGKLPSYRPLQKRIILKKSDLAEFVANSPNRKVADKKTQSLDVANHRSPEQKCTSVHYSTDTPSQ